MDVASDPTLRACVKAARAWGVSLSVFMGMPQITEYEYDGRGKVVRTVTSPQWLDEDREAAFSLMAYESQLCPNGHYLPESSASEAEEDYDVELVGLCHECVAEEQAAKRWEDHKHPQALLSRTQRKGTADEEREG